MPSCLRELGQQPGRDAPQMREISRLFGQTNVLTTRLVERLRSNGFNHPSYAL